MVIRKEHDSRILGLQPTCAFVFVENAKLQVVLIKEMTTEQKRQTMFVGIDVHKDTHTAVGISPFGEKLFELTVGNYKKDFEVLTDKVKEILKLKKKDANAGTARLEAEINSLVFDLYGISPEERKIIQKAIE